MICALQVHSMNCVTFLISNGIHVAYHLWIVTGFCYDQFGQKEIDAHVISSLLSLRDFYLNKWLRAYQLCYLSDILIGVKQKFQ